MKIENRSRKQIHKLDGIGVGRIRTFPFLPIPFTTPSLMVQWKLGCRGSRSGRTNQSQSPESNIVIGLFFRFCLRLRQCSLHLIVSSGDISRISVLLPTPSVWFSLGFIALPFWLRLRLRLRRLYCARKFACLVSNYRARALSTKMNNDRADGHCYSFAWI